MSISPEIAFGFGGFNVWSLLTSEISKLSIKNIKTDNYKLHYPSKSVAIADVKNISLSVSLSKPRNTDTLIPPSDIVFIAVSSRKNTSQNYLSFFCVCLRILSKLLSLLSGLRGIRSHPPSFHLRDDLWQRGSGNSDDMLTAAVSECSK